MAAPDKYTYDALVVRVIDGDTIVADIDLGMWTWLHSVKLRLKGINMPELTTSDGWAALRQMQDLVLNARRVRIKTTKTKAGREVEDKYGRLLAEVWIGDVNINEQMLQWWEARKNERA